MYPGVDGVDGDSSPPVSPSDLPRDFLRSTRSRARFAYCMRRSLTMVCGRVREEGECGTRSAASPAGTMKKEVGLDTADLISSSDTSPTMSSAGVSSSGACAHTHGCFCASASAPRGVTYGPPRSASHATHGNLRDRNPGAGVPIQDALDEVAKLGRHVHVCREAQAAGPRAARESGSVATRERPPTPRP